MIANEINQKQLRLKFQILYFSQPRCGILKDWFCILELEAKES